MDASRTGCVWQCRSLDGGRCGQSIVAGLVPSNAPQPMPMLDPVRSTRGYARLPARAGDVLPRRLPQLRRPPRTTRHAPRPRRKPARCARRAYPWSGRCPSLRGGRGPRGVARGRRRRGCRGRGAGGAGAGRAAEFRARRRRLPAVLRRADRRDHRVQRARDRTRRRDARHVPRRRTASRLRTATP